MSGVVPLVPVDQANDTVLENVDDAVALDHDVGLGGVVLAYVVKLSTAENQTAV